MTNQTNEILIKNLPRITKALEEISRKLPEPPEDSFQASVDRYHKFLSEGFTPETIETLPPDIQEAIKGYENILKRPTQK